MDSTIAFPHLNTLAMDLDACLSGWCGALTILSSPLLSWEKTLYRPPPPISSKIARLHSMRSPLHPRTLKLQMGGLNSDDWIVRGSFARRLRLCHSDRNLFSVSSHFEYREGQGVQKARTGRKRCFQANDREG